MLIYKDKFSGDEVCSDSYPSQKMFEDTVLKVEAKNITESNTVSDAAIGGNKSAEAVDDDGGTEDSATTGLNIALAHKLVLMDYKKKDFIAYIKEYCKRVVKFKEVQETVDLDDESTQQKEEGEQTEGQKKLKEQLSVFVKDVLQNFKDYQFYIGESMNPYGQVLLCRWEEEKPFFYLIRDGFIEEKF